jgi:hypothetical protein
MQTFAEYVVRRDEASFNVTDYTPMKDNPDSWIYKGLGAAAGVAPAAASGLVPATIGVMKAFRGSKSRAYGAAAAILDYINKNESWRGPILNNIRQAVKAVESVGYESKEPKAGRAMGVVGGGEFPSVNTAGYSKLADIGSAVWKGVMTSARNVADTLFGSSGITTGNLMKFKEAFTILFQAIGQLPPRVAHPLLKNLEQALVRRGGTWRDLEASIWK